MAIKNKSNRELLEQLGGKTDPGSTFNDLIKMAVSIQNVESIEKAVNKLTDSMNENAKSNDRLSKKIFALNLILTIATVIGTLIAFFSLVFNQFLKILVQLF